MKYRAFLYLVDGDLRFGIVSSLLLLTKQQIESITGFEILGTVTINKQTFDIVSEMFERGANCSVTAFTNCTETVI